MGGRRNGPSLQVMSVRIEYRGKSEDGSGMKREREREKGRVVIVVIKRPSETIKLTPPPPLSIRHRHQQQAAAPPAGTCARVCIGIVWSLSSSLPYSPPLFFAYLHSIPPSTLRVSSSSQVIYFFISFLIIHAISSLFFIN